MEQLITDWAARSMDPQAFMRIFRAVMVLLAVLFLGVFITSKFLPDKLYMFDRRVGFILLIASILAGVCGYLAGRYI